MVSDLKVLTRARAALSGSPHSNLRELQVELMDDALVISGKVDSFYQKQMAQEAIRAVCCGIELQNTVNVSQANSSVIRSLVPFD